MAKTNIPWNRAVSTGHNRVSFKGSPPETRTRGAAEKGGEEGGKVKIYEVGRGKPYKTIQEAVDAAPSYCPDGLHINVTVRFWEKILWSLQKIKGGRK